MLSRSFSSIFLCFRFRTDLEVYEGTCLAGVLLPGSWKEEAVDLEAVDFEAGGKRGIRLFFLAARNPRSTLHKAV